MDQQNKDLELAPNGGVTRDNLETNGSWIIRKSFWKSSDDDNSSNGDLVIRLGDNIGGEGTANQGYSIGMGKSGNKVDQ